jgi:hypothetical protein
MKTLTGVASVVVLAVCVPAVAARGSEAAGPTWAVEVRAGPYRPMSATAAGRAYYEEFFDRRNPWMPTLELDRYLGDALGPLGVFAGVGLWSTSAKALVCKQASVQISCTTDVLLRSDAENAAQGIEVSRGSESTAISLVPLTAGIVYRFEAAERLLGVPLVPFAKLGFAYVPWRMSTAARSRRGASMGLQGAAGLAMALDWLEPGRASRSGAATFSSYAFADVTRLQVNDFGRAKSLDLRSTSFELGLALSFR